MEKNLIAQYFEDVETTKEYDGYFYKVTDAITIILPGSICGLKNISQIHQWASSDRVKGFLKEKFQVKAVPCYYWLLCLVKLIKPESFNRCFTKWAASMLPQDRENLTLSLDGKTICSTGKMECYESPLHIVSAQVGELGITFAQQTVGGKSNEIPAVRELLEQLEPGGCLVVADALNCQKDTARTILSGKGDYLLCAKDNQENLKKEIEEYVQDETLRKSMEKKTETEKNRERLEKRTSFVTSEISWMQEKEGWEGLKCTGALHTEFEVKGVKSNEWHYYIAGRELTAEELLRHARMEWSVETMHWLLDVHYSEDQCRIEDKNIQQNLNMIRKLAINLIKRQKERTASKRAISKIMFDCLLDPSCICDIIEN